MTVTSLNTLLQGIVPVPSVFDLTIHGLKTDSREVASGDVFIALAGLSSPADTYVDAAHSRRRPVRFFWKLRNPASVTNTMVP